MSTLDLAIIVKPTDDEAKLLDRCLTGLAKDVDNIYITITGENKACQKVAKKWGANISRFDWTQDFAAARNFSFSQCQGDYIFWCDADDIVNNSQGLKDLVKQMDEKKIDAAVMNYLYDFDDQKRCTVKHLKTRIVKNDGCVKWVGEVHEDFAETRQISSYFCEDIEIAHLTDGKRAGEAAKRNTEIAKKTLKEKPDDPRSYWLMGNAMMGEGKTDQAKPYFSKFLELSSSNQEKYLAYLALADLEAIPSEAINYILQALNLFPSWPLAYLRAGYRNMDLKRWQAAIDFIMLGLQMPDHYKTEMIVYNPREYDYIPLMNLTHCYKENGQIVEAAKTIGALGNLLPQDKHIKTVSEAINAELHELNAADSAIAKAEKIKDKEELKIFLDDLPEKLKQHPKICLFRNLHFVKETSSGRDLVIVCGYTNKEWNPEIADTTGIGGSEEAVINLSKRLVKLGWNVTVYNNCGKENKVYDGVSYKHYWEWNYRDKQDVTIIWRIPKFLDYDINSKVICLDMHDALGEGEFNQERIKKVDKIFVKSKAHRILYPNVPDEKIAVISNGIDPDLFELEVEKNPYLIINTSSPDRHLDATLDIFEELIKREPDKPWKLAWYYGWGVYDAVHADNPQMMEWKAKQMERFNKLKEIGRAEGGEMIGHKDIAKKYLEAGIFLYPTEFMEINCISAIKAQLAGCYPITSDFAALNETVQFGMKIHTKGERWSKDNFFGDLSNKGEYLTWLITSSLVDVNTMKKWAKENFDWNVISQTWHDELINLCSKKD